MVRVRRKRNAAGFGVALCATAIALTLGACSQEPEPEPEPLTLSQAGEAYAKVICPVNEAWDEVDGLVDDMRSALVLQPTDLELREELLSTSLEELAKTSNRAADELADQRGVMPEATREPVQAMIETLRDDAEQALEVAELPAAKIVDHEWQGVEAATEATTKVREGLGIEAGQSLTCTKE